MAWNALARWQHGSRLIDAAARPHLPLLHLPVAALPPPGTGAAGDPLLRLAVAASAHPIRADMVVDAATRGRVLGLRIVRRLVDIARDTGCYKIIIDCTPKLRAYYAKCGFLEKGVQMAVYF